MTRKELLEVMMEVVTTAGDKAQEDYKRRLMDSIMMRSSEKLDWETSGEKYCYYIFTYLRKALSTAIENTNQAQVVKSCASR